MKRTVLDSSTEKACNSKMCVSVARASVTQRRQLMLLYPMDGLLCVSSLWGKQEEKKNVPQSQACVVSMADHLLPQAFGIFSFMYLWGQQRLFKVWWWLWDLQDSILHLLFESFSPRSRTELQLRLWVCKKQTLRGDKKGQPTTVLLTLGDDSENAGSS